MVSTDEQIIIEVYQEFQAVIEKRDSEFVIVDSDLNADDKKVKDIYKLIKKLLKP